MKEHDEIDELFKNGLEDFRPDATHLHYAPIAEALTSKTAVMAVKAGFWSKWGFAVLLGTTALTGTTAAILWSGKQEVSLRTAIQHMQPTAVEFIEKIREEGGIIHEPGTISKSLNTASQDIFQEGTEHHSAGFSRGSEVHTLRSMQSEPSVVATLSSATDADKQQQLISLTALNQQLKTFNDPRYLGTNIQGAEDLEGIPVYRKKGRKLTSGYLEKNAPGLEVLNVAAKSDSLNGILAALNGEDASKQRLMPQNEPVWPKREFNFRAGLAFVPLQNEVLTVSYIPDTVIGSFWKSHMTNSRPSNKNEILLSFNYQQQLRNRLELGVGFNMYQGGWRAFEDFYSYYFEEDANGNLFLVTDSMALGETDVTFRAYGLNLSLGYHFPINEKLAFGVNGGISGNQVMTTFAYQSYLSGETTTTKNTRFALSLFALGELTYKLGPVGISFGANINGRYEMSRVFQATSFYNNLSFGVHTGIHYYLPVRP